MGQMWEQVIGKLTALMGLDSRMGQCGVPFTHIDRLRTVCEGLHARGYPSMGRPQALSIEDRLPPREPLYSGITGDRLDGNVFIGLVYYQRLRHMVQDKFHARALGPKLMSFCNTTPASLSTNWCGSQGSLFDEKNETPAGQPTEGRARHGGLRIGEMERFCVHFLSAMMSGRKRSATA